MALAVFHAAVLVLNTYTIWYDQSFIIIPVDNEDVRHLPLKARVTFLTMWTLFFQTAYYGVALLNDIFGTNAAAPKNAPLIRKFKDLLFSTAWPSATFVSTAFWGLYYVDKELIFPDHIEKLFPRWVNHVMHTFVMVFILIELVLSNITYPKRKYGVSLAVSYFGGYIIWVFVMYFSYNYWAYPVMHFFNWPLRIAFTTTNFSFSISLYFVGEKIVCFFSKPQKVKSKKR